MTSFEGSLGPWRTGDRWAKGAKVTLAKDARLTDEDHNVIGTIESLEMIDGELIVSGTVTDPEMSERLKPPMAQFSLGNRRIRRSNEGWRPFDSA